MVETVNQQRIPPRRARQLSLALVEWYRAHARALPWRETRDPYAIWVSEVMLQQTRVEAVVGRYRQFLDRFPDLETLAAAEATEVLAEWAGLGYYRRARQLHAAARQLVRDGEGRLPEDPAALSLLPGFGRYTAGAVASIAFGRAVPAVDGNVERVLSRLLALEENPQRSPGRAIIEGAARALLDERSPGELNQALMELGATLCTPRSPECGRCPWRRGCKAARSGSPERWPARAPRPTVLEVVSYVAVAREGELWMWRRRPEGLRNAGLWELPATEFLVPGSPADSALRDFGRSLGQDWQVSEPLATVRHSITRHRVTFVAHAVRSEPVASTGADLRWASADEAQAWGLTAATAKLLRRLPTLL